MYPGNGTSQCTMEMELANVPWEWDYPMCPRNGNMPWEWDYPMCPGNGTS